jgi:hypothetical protein
MTTALFTIGIITSLLSIIIVLASIVRSYLNEQHTTAFNSATSKMVLQEFDDLDDFACDFTDSFDRHHTITKQTDNTVNSDVCYKPPLDGTATKSISSTSSISHQHLHQTAALSSFVENIDRNATSTAAFAPAVELQSDGEDTGEKCDVKVPVFRGVDGAQVDEELREMV